MVTGSDYIQKLQSEEKRVQQDRNKAKQRLAQLIQEANEDLPAGLAALEESKAVRGNILSAFHLLSIVLQDAEREQEGLMQQGEGVVRQKNEIDNEQRVLLVELNRIRGALSDFEGLRTEKNVRWCSC